MFQKEIDSVVSPSLGRNDGVSCMHGTDFDSAQKLFANIFRYRSNNPPETSQRSTRSLWSPRINSLFCFFTLIHLLNSSVVFNLRSVFVAQQTCFETALLCFVTSNQRTEKRSLETWPTSLRPNVPNFDVMNLARCFLCRNLAAHYRTFTGRKK